VDVNIGDDSTGNGSQACPFKTISKAATISGSTVHVAPGTYSDATGEQFPLTLPDGVSIIGATSSSFPAGPVVQFLTGARAGQYYLFGVNAGTVVLDTLTLSDQTSNGQEGDVQIEGGQVTMTDCTLKAGFYAGLRMGAGTAQLNGCSITGNGQMGIAFDGGDLALGQDAAGTPTHIDANNGDGIQFEMLRPGSLTATAGTTFANNTLAAIEVLSISMPPAINLTGCSVANAVSLGGPATLTADSTRFSSSVYLTATGATVNLTNCQFAGAGLLDSRNCQPGCGWSSIQGTTFTSAPIAVEVIYTGPTDGAHNIDLGGGGDGSTGGNQLNSPLADKNNVGIELASSGTGAPSESVHADNDAWSACPPTVSTTVGPADVVETGTLTVSATTCSLGK
jgi:hypothetical protein